MSNNYIYSFRSNYSEFKDIIKTLPQISDKESKAKMKNFLGGKGAGLQEMSSLGLPVPAGFTISTDLCAYYYKHRTLPSNFLDKLVIAIKELESDTGKTFGSTTNPLFLSVRSGSVVSMPGMMDTVLNLGINDDICQSLIKELSEQKFILDCYKRFLEMYGTVVLSIPRTHFEVISIDSGDEISALTNIIAKYKAVMLNHNKSPIPLDPLAQLVNSIESILKSYYSDRAIIYRKLHNIPDTGTAVTVQSMVFGNLNDNSATGVVFTRSPSTGENKLFGEFLINAQGEDVVGGFKTPLSLDDSQASLQVKMPQIFTELKNVCEILEKYYCDMQDIEFTVENGKLFLLQTRSGKRNAAAAVKIAVDMVKQNLISKSEAILRIDSESINQLLHSSIDYTKCLTKIATGSPASPGAATGMVVFSSHDAEIFAIHHDVILIRQNTSPEDIKGMHCAKAIITVNGGVTSHAAVVARGMGKPCICGVPSMTVNEVNKTLVIGEFTISHGEIITIDGATGAIFLGATPLVQPVFSDEFNTILNWSSEIKALKVRANAETEIDAVTALKFGAEGIGLCRTEHMFFREDKISLIREMIVSPDKSRKLAAIRKLLPLQIEDFTALFRIMRGLPVNIRLLDPPLHEFLPNNMREKIELANSLDLPFNELEYILETLHEINPMLGHRGCRLGISNPEIYQMQITAIFESVAKLQKENIETKLELMIPLVSNVHELDIIKSYIEVIAKDYPSVVGYKIGTMIELPRSALQAKSLAKQVDFFDFGTNDLTQTTYGISRDDISSFLPTYIEKNIFTHDPFIRLDEEGVGELIEIAAKRGKLGNSELKLGACGEHAGDSTSIEFFHKVGLDYISCSPYRIPIARIAAAQAQIKFNR